MPIKSYLAFPEEGKKGELSQKLANINNCEVVPAENKDLIVLMTETFSEEEEKALLDKLNNIEELKHFSLVSGFADKENN